MPAGLREELGLGEPQSQGASPQGSTEQADQFRAAFQAAIGGVNESLQYTAAHAEQEKHNPQAGKRDTTCSAYQVALGRIDPTNPAVAQGAIDQVLAAVQGLSSAVDALKQAVERAYNAWIARESDLDAVTDKIREMVEWGHDKASALQQIIEAIASKANVRKWEEALQALEQLLSKITPVYEEFLRQKAAQEEYEPALAGLEPQLAETSTCEFASLEARQQEITTAADQMRQAAESKDFVSALEQLRSLEQQVADYLNDVEQLRARKEEYEQARADLEPRLGEASTSEFASLAELDQQIADLTTRMDEAATAEDYEQALQIVNELSTKVEEKLTRVEELEALKEEYETGRAALEPRLTEASTSELSSTSGIQEEMIQLQSEMEAAAEAQDYENAVRLMGELETKLTEYEAIKEQRDEYESRLAALQPQLTEASISEERLAYVAPIQSEMATLQTEMEAAAEAEDYENALRLLGELEAKVEEFFAAIEEKKAEYEAARDSALDKMSSCTVKAREYPTLKADRDALMPKKGEMEQAAGAEDYEKALELAKELETMATKYLSDAEKAQEKFDKKGEEISKALDDANYLTRDDVAREWAHKLTDEQLKFLPSEVRNRMMEEMQDGVFSDDDKKAINRMYEVRTLDPEFEKEERKNREKLIEALRNDPEMAKYRKDWPTLTPEERVKLMEKVANYQVEAYNTKDIPGAPALKVDTYTEKPDPDGGITMGTYNHGSGKFNINLDPNNPAIKDFDRALDLATHEAGHRYQHDLVDRLNRGELKEGDPLYNQAVTFKLNDNYYPEDPWKVYSNQPMEAHSRISGQGIQNAGIGT